MNKLLSCIKGEGAGRRLLKDRDLPGVNFQWQEIIDGTGNFHPSNHLGKGNFGDVFRCDLPGTSQRNQVGAAKIQNEVVHQDARREFQREIKTLHEANHPNVINLVGKCTDSERSVIIYEFMPKGSLDFHLYEREEKNNPFLDWDTRMKIAVGVAEGLAYLHGRLKVIHLDIKDSNVLLDENFVPKLTDFGLATKVVEGRNGVEKQTKMKPIKGTRGFIAPETERRGKVSTKSDVYSYGVFLLTLFTGRKAYDTSKPEGKFKITDWFNPAWRNEQLRHLAVDNDLTNRYSIAGLERLLETVRECINPEALERPHMRSVVERVRAAARFPVGSSQTNMVSFDDWEIR